MATAQRVSLDDIYGYDEGASGGGSASNLFGNIVFGLVCGLILFAWMSNNKSRIRLVIYASSLVLILAIFKYWGRESGIFVSVLSCIYAVSLDPVLKSKFNSLSLGNYKYFFGFAAILWCLGLFFYLKLKPAAISSSMSIPTTAAVPELPAAREIIDSKDNWALGGQSTDKPSEVNEKISNDFGKQSSLSLATDEVLVTGSSAAAKSFSPEQEAWLGNADRTDPFILARMRRAVPDR